MPELIIKYKNKRALEALKDFSRYFDFSIIMPTEKTKRKTIEINGVTIVAADSTVNTSELESVFSRGNFDAKQIREKSWQRNK
jgi:hypothetical protein